MNDMSNCAALIAALEAGGYDCGPGQALKVESLECTMRLVTYLDIPTRMVDGRRQPALNIYGKYYEFHYDRGQWVQVPSNYTALNPTLVWCDIWTYTIGRKRLTPYRMRQVNKKLNHYLEFFLPELEKEAR